MNTQNIFHGHRNCQGSLSTKIQLLRKDKQELLRTRNTVDVFIAFALWNTGKAQPSTSQ